MSIEDLEEIRQEHETWLAELEGLAVEAIASNNWDTFYAHVVDFQNEHDLHGETGIAIGEDRPSDLEKYFARFKDKAEASTKSLSGSGADPSQATEEQSKGMNQSCHNSPN
jgi:hypothetical protein